MLSEVESGQVECPHLPSAWDRVGILLSLLCTVHCILLPVATLLLPWSNHFTNSVTFHWLIAAIVVPVGLFAFVRGYMAHRRMWVIVTGVAGIALLVMGLLLPEGHLFVFDHSHHSFGSEHDHNTFFNQEGLLTLIGSLVLVIAHIGNLRSCHHDHS